MNQQPSPKLLNTYSGKYYINKAEKELRSNIFKDEEVFILEQLADQALVSN